MDQVLNQYANQVRTLQHAIKTQNEVLINKIATVLNQVTLEALQKLDQNLNEFTENYQKIQEYNIDHLQRTNLTLINIQYLKEEVTNYAQSNLKNLREQMSTSITALQNSQPIEQPNSSLLDVMQLLLKATELYSKNLKEALIFTDCPKIEKPVQSISNYLNGQKISYDSRIAKIDVPFQSLNFTLQQSITSSQIFDIFPFSIDGIMLIATYENELLIYDINTSQVLIKLESLRFVPSSCIQLYKLANSQIKKSSIILLGGSEFDPNLYAFDIFSGKKIQTFPGHERSIKFLIQLGDLNTIVSVGRDSKIYFWDYIKGEPKQIQNIPTFEIIDFQIQIQKQQLYTLGIDGKMCVIKLTFEQTKINGLDWGEFQKAKIVNLIDIAQTSSLSSIILRNDSLMVISFASGWLTGINQIKIFEEIPMQASVKMKNIAAISLQSEIYQINTFLIKNSDKMIIVTVQRNTGQIYCYQYPELQELKVIQKDNFEQPVIQDQQQLQGQEQEQGQQQQVEGQQQQQQQQQQQTIRWNIKLIYQHCNKIGLIKYGKDNNFEIFDIII